ncbi:jumonji superfamily protein [Crepidotus variabilis]|uniref:[histone H3]-trimethyl-L-lysine(4) demethylase n=1 Tax=Crepidotus variabilis TaxID=179855 RepID=A0A9P6ESP0_9AGAR|nr:jumonji superfamily protein [Crepidotus variabilis]
MHGSPLTTTPRGTPSRRGKSPRFSSESLGQAGSSTLPSSKPGNKPGNTFVSCLDIPVQGAIPIDGESRTNSSAMEVTQSNLPESKRAPRKSKTEALAALNNQSRSSSVSLDEMDETEDLAAKYRHMPAILVTPHLDLSTVKTWTPRVSAAATRTPRPFGLTDCPEFHPTREEFKDPMAYITTISAEASQYGICKIIPPRDWKMPFVTDTESFRFKTRLQRLNNIEASSRAKLNFLEQLYQFHKQQGNSRVVVPTINHKPLDLWLLRKEVHKLGGYDAVTKAKKWSDLGRILGYRGIPGLSTQIKNSYTRVILPFEHYCDRGRSSPAASANVTRDMDQKMTSVEESLGKSTRLSTTAPSTQQAGPPGSPLTATSSPLSEPVDETEPKEQSEKPPSPRLRRSSRMTSVEQTPKKPLPLAVPGPLPTPVFYDRQKPDVKIGTPEVRTPNQAGSVPSPTSLREQQNCEICHKKNRGDEMLLCDGCDCGFHMFCLDPALDSIPKEQWFCYTCLAGAGGDFGFDEGEEHSLSSFQARDKEFRRLWFESHRPANAHIPPEPSDITKNRVGSVYVSEHDVEEEFWRLVQSPKETVEIEYGADIHSTTHGSAMPTMETHPLEPYSRDPWNLNNIPILPDSLLRFIKSDISGMTVPWTYVGMTFSTFCWHNEDHYTYSINYMHWGETKTWYGIPGQDAEKFEAAIKSEAPDLFESQPDLLFQLVTLMNPERLTEAGVKVHACNQRAGEFVVTFPKAYHAGFNHGLNFNEAVNFALPDWLKLGRECVQRYRDHRKLPVFSHDELLITITQQSQSIKTAMWLIDTLREMTDRELLDRQKARTLGFPESLEEKDRPEDQYQCTVCKAFCYLSQITCACSTKVVCVDHHDLLCETRGAQHLILRKRFPDEELTETLTKFAERAAAPATWQRKLLKVLSESARPNLRTLRALLAEGDRINYLLPEMANLRKCVTRANEWVDSANSFTIRKQSRKRSRRSKGRSTEITSEDPGDRPDRGLDDLYALLREIQTLGFECTEMGVLRAIAEEAEEVKRKASELLSTMPSEDEREDFLADCKRLLLEGSSVNVLLDELSEVEKIVDREQLLTEMETKLDDNEPIITLEEVRHFLTRARQCNLPEDNKYMEMLHARQREGNDWETRARNVLDQPIKTIEELNEFADMDSNIPIDPTVLNRLMTCRAKALDFEKQAKAWLACENSETKARIPDVMRLASRASKDFSIYSVQLLKRSADIAADLELRCENVLRNRYFNNDEDVFSAIAKWKEYAQAHLNMFALPNFDQLEKQVRKHELWLQTIPWYCPEHNETHSQEVLDDVLENTRPEDDLPPNDEFFTCICNSSVRPPPNGSASDAVQCDHCFARFHGECAKNGGSCPFCDHQHWNGTIHKQRNFHFCFLPTIMAGAPDVSRNYSDDYKKLEIIVHRVDRLSAIIGQFLSYTSVPEHQLPEYLPQVRHYMRKLFKIQFAVSPNPEISFGLDLAGLHRILASRPVVTRPKKRRKPRFTFGQDVDNDWTDGTRCICRGRMTILDSIHKVECELCNRRYHKGCVFLPDNKIPTHPMTHFTCPICCLRKGKTYPYSEVRVIAAGEKRPLDVYVDTKQMLDAYSKSIIFKQMPPPQAPTLFVELVQFHAGSDGASIPTPSNSRPVSHRAIPSYPPPPPLPPSYAHAHHGPPPSMTHAPPPPSVSTFHSSAAPPPPPWSRWAPTSTPTMPPSTQRRAPNGEGPRTIAPYPPPQPTSRKRKHPEEMQHHHHHHHHHHPRPEDDNRLISSYPLKRHAGPSLTPTPISTPPRPVQTLSPSLAMIVSPTNQAVLSSPRGAQLPPLMRNGANGSPILPPVKSLMSGDSRGPPL